MLKHHESLECRRLLASGAIDLSFGNAGVVTAPFGADVKLGKPVVLGNGKILVPGSA